MAIVQNHLLNYFEQLFDITREACTSIAQSAPEHGTAPSRRRPFPVGGGMPQLCATLGRHTPSGTHPPSGIQPPSV